MTIWLGRHRLRRDLCCRLISVNGASIENIERFHDQWSPVYFLRSETVFRAINESQDPDAYKRTANVSLLNCKMSLFITIVMVCHKKEASWRQVTCLLINNQYCKPTKDQPQTSEHPKVRKRSRWDKLIRGIGGRNTTIKLTTKKHPAGRS